MLITDHEIEPIAEGHNCLGSPNETSYAANITIKNSSSANGKADSNKTVATMPKTGT